MYFCGRRKGTVLCATSPKKRAPAFKEVFIKALSKRYDYKLN